MAQWLSVGCCWRVGAWSTLRRRPQSMRRISTVSAESGLQTRRDNKPLSVASWSWYSSSQVDLMLMSRKRANSFELAEPHPSTMLNATDSAALAIWAFSDPRSPRENPRIARRTFNTSSCDLCHTSNRRKSCTRALSPRPHQSRRPFFATPPKSLPHPLLTTTDNCPTNQLTTQYLDSLSATSNHTKRDSGKVR